LYAAEYDDVMLPKPDEIIYLALPFWLSRKRAELRAQNGGPKLDVVESDIEYVKQGHNAGLFYAQHFGWSIVDGFQNSKELTREEVHQAIVATLGYAG
jgi:hypothetical protein